MGVSEYFNLIRENLGFLVIFAFFMPCTVRAVELTTGESALLFTSVIGAAGAYTTFEGITFDFDFFRFTALSTLFYWAVGLLVVFTNVVILFYVWEFSQGRKNRRELISSVMFMVFLSFLFGSSFSLGESITIPLPWVAAAVVVRLFTSSSKEVASIPPQDPKQEQGEAPAQLELHHESAIFADTQIASPVRRRAPKFFFHGLAFSLLDLIFGLMWPILTGVAYITGTHLGSTGTLVYIAFAFGSLFIGGGLINAWISEKVWNIKWNYSIGILFLSGVILFVITQVMVSPLSLIINTFLLDSLVGIVVIVVFRYTVVAFVIGIVGLLISFNFKPTEKPSDLLTQIEQVIDQPPLEESKPSEEDSSRKEWENQ